MERSRSELCEVYMRESSLPHNRANAELDRTLNQLLMFADFITSDSYPEVVFHAGINDLRKTHIPLGPIAVFGSSNFPFAYSTAGGDTASALAAGCTVIVKAHPMHAGTGELVAKCIVDAVLETGMPDGVFSNLNINDHQLGAYLVQHPLLRGVGFTGSLKGGRALFDLAQKRETPIPFFAEMGSLNPVCIHPSAISTTEEIDHWASMYARSISDNAGQFCTKPGLIFSIKGDSLDQFKSRLTEYLSQRELQSMLHPDLFANYRNTVDVTKEVSGVNTLNGTEDLSGSAVSNTLLSCPGAEFIVNEHLRHEMFGPAAIIVECGDMVEIIQALSKLEGQLTGTLIFEGSVDDEVRTVFDLLSERAGRVIVNGVPTGVEVCEAMHHGGPYPATTDSRFSAVGAHAIRRWLRPVVYQNVPPELLPVELR